MENVGKEHQNAATVILFGIISLAYVFLNAMVFTFLESTWSYEDALYFVVITMSTIGYGDYSPSNTLSQVYTVIFVFSSLFLLFAIFQAVISYFVNKQYERVKEGIQKRLLSAEKKRTESAISTPPNQDLMQNENDGRKNTVGVNLNVRRIFDCDELYRIIFGKIQASRFSPIIAYLIMYSIWLVIWVLYFNVWNHDESKKFTAWQAFYFGVITSSTVGYGDYLPTTDDGSTLHDSKVFTLFWALSGVVLLAMLAGQVSGVLLDFLLKLLRCPCCVKIFGKFSKNTNLNSKETEMQIAHRTVMNIKSKGAIDLRQFLQLQYKKDEIFQKKLEKACQLFDKYDIDGDKTIDFSELQMTHSQAPSDNENDDNDNDNDNENNDKNDGLGLVAVE